MQEKMNGYHEAQYPEFDGDFMDETAHRLGVLQGRLEAMEKQMQSYSQSTALISSKIDAISSRLDRRDGQITMAIAFSGMIAAFVSLAVPIILKVLL